MAKRSTSWKRVRRTKTPDNERMRQNRNKQAKGNPTFLAACEKAGVQPTHRQASKWNNKRGAARAVGKGGF